jgi:hypothetical protein
MPTVIRRKWEPGIVVGFLKFPTFGAVPHVPETDFQICRQIPFSQKHVSELLEMTGAVPVTTSSGGSGDGAEHGEI